MRWRRAARGGCDEVASVCHAPLRETDKTFLIAKPMRTAAWTKRLAAGSGERGTANGRGVLAGGGLWGFGRRCE
jgi:hypothetical protein